MAGDVIYAMMPFAKIHEWAKYGKYAANTAMDGFEASEAAIMVAYSEDDDVVPVQYGYDLYYEKYGNNPRFKAKCDKWAYRCCPALRAL